MARFGDGQGYILVNSPRGGYIYEHRLVMEKQIGRPLATHEHVHHINHKRDDNRPANLVLTRQGLHQHLYHKGDRRKPHFSYNCIMCGTPKECFMSEYRKTLKRYGVPPRFCGHSCKGKWIAEGRGRASGGTFL